ncbi:gamma-glutamylcyclotransferase [Saccharopolyspora mangrovi]|uniref:Gamma-glutamylcyclotransferase n=1 Tax=Saccharopolyspora mangrovi TaxID=3082379 RepID=A0ABU6AKY0_9PSEU|nr:gamma-glutamylcyclotransferase [Saccharopolyspora sp. S2-29]MEB3372218.1 gamma-glutamylcyclotransferase [Saccharopolyspora sp. S2-29]
MTVVNALGPATFRDAEFPADPYPGARPGHSYLHLDGQGWRLWPDVSSPSGWRVGSGCLDALLTGLGAEPLAARWPVLAYGSNVCPSKITWLREELGLGGPVVVLSATCTGLSAVWASGVRARDGQRPAVLVSAPGVVEHHAVWLATAEQRRVLDACEGRGERYRLVRLHGPERVELETGRTAHVLAYGALGEIRRPLLVDGRWVPCNTLGQHEARELTGIPATSDGLTCTEIVGEPGPPPAAAPR